MYQLGRSSGSCSCRSTGPRGRRGSAIEPARASPPSRGFSCHPDLEAYWVVGATMAGPRPRVCPAVGHSGDHLPFARGPLLGSPGTVHAWVNKPMIEMRFYLSTIDGP